NFPLQPGTKPVSRPPHRAAPNIRDTIRQCVTDMEKQDIIKPSSSPWTFPVTIVAKPDGSPRFCADFRGTINKHLIRNSWPLPSMDECLSSLGGSKYLYCLDIQSAYWQLQITDEYERQETAFITPDGKYEFQSSGLLIYFDDIVLASPSWTHHKELITTVLSLLEDVGITLKPSKAQFGSKQIHYLVHDVSPQGIAVSQARVEAILDMHPPQTVKGLQSFLGSMNFVRKYIPHLATATEPLVELIRHTHKIKWNRPQKTAFDECKRLLSTGPVLHFPDFSKDFFIHVDASNVGTGAFLAHKNEYGNFDIIAYHSALLSPSQRKYSATQKEYLAVILAIQHWRPYIWGKHSTVITDHSALRWL
ncbi:unnamed protein product, partial [Choristocarpus tenellus]